AVLFGHDFPCAIVKGDGSGGKALPCSLIPRRAFQDNDDFRLLEGKRIDVVATFPSTPIRRKEPAETRLVFSVNQVSKVVGSAVNRIAEVLGPAPLGFASDRFERIESTHARETVACIVKCAIRR